MTFAICSAEGSPQSPEGLLFRDKACAQRDEHDVFDQLTQKETMTAGQ